ncbi:hypothetical protein [Chlorella virus XW01]|nr:hypothetical protein [Chlorella virus XW01]
MFINNIDKILNDILDDLNKYLIDNKSFDEFKKDVNFVKYNSKILNVIKDFYNKSITDKLKKEIDSAIGKNSELVLNLIKRYTAYYVFLGIGYHYTDGRDLFITNMIEISKNQMDGSFIINNFFDSENNSRIITFFSDIKNITSLVEFKTMDRIKIVIQNYPIKYQNVDKLIKELGEDYFEEFFLIKNNFHNIVKTFIIRLIYLGEERNDLIELLNQKETSDAIYKYIDIVIAKEDKLADFSIIQKFLKNMNLNVNKAQDIYNYLEEFKVQKEFLVKSNKDFLNYLFSKKIMFPITEDFLRYHKDTEKYNVGVLLKDSFTEREATRIKLVLSKISKIRNLYSEMAKNNLKLKSEILDQFYKQMEDKKAVLFNDVEELKIIQRLEMSDKADDIDLLVDLDNIRKYVYQNFKDIENDGFKLRTEETIEGVRLTSILNKKTKSNMSNKLETRIGHNNIDMNVVGVIWNPSKKPFECFSYNDLVDLRKQDENGFEIFVKTMSENFTGTDNKKLYYWIFNKEKDVPELSQYKNLANVDTSRYIKNLLEEIYFRYINLVENKISDFINKQKHILTYEINKIISRQKLFDLDLIPETKNNLILLASKKEPNFEPIYKDEIIDFESKMKLPTIKKIGDTLNILEINIKKVDDDIKLEEGIIPICHHYLKWDNISNISRKNVDEINQSVFNFIKEYVRQNDDSEYVCKSCGEFLKLKKYVFEGTYVKELDMFLTTNLATHVNLEDLPKYAKLIKTIRNIQNNLEKIANGVNMTGFLGSAPEIILRKKTTVRNVIDMILIHSNYIKKFGENVKRKISETFNIKLSSLIFFPLEDNIFVTKTDVIDKLKMLKYNNVLSYLVLMIITDLNAGMILSFKEDKKSNFYLFSSLMNNIFGDIQIRINEKEKVNIIKLPLLCYCLYMTTSYIINSKIWMGEYDDIKKHFLYQRSLIETVVDLFNTIINAYYSYNNSDIKDNNKENDYLYEIMSQKFINVINNLFTNNTLYEELKKKNMSNVRISDNKVSFITKVATSIKVPELFIYKNLEELKDIIGDYCLSDTETNSVEKSYLDLETRLNELTLCPDGKLHEWEIKNKELICKKCNKNIKELSEKVDNNQLKLLKLSSLKKLTKTFCITGEYHDLENNICKKCKVNPTIYNYSEKDLLSLERNLKNKDEIKHINILNSIMENQKELEMLDNKIDKIIRKLNKRNEIKGDRDILKYINKFITKLKSISGDRIMFNKEELLLDKNIIIIKNNQNGGILSKEIKLMVNDYRLNQDSTRDIIRKIYHDELKKDVYVYFDNNSKTFFYYDCYTLFYLGYSRDTKTINIVRSNIAIEIIPSIKEKLKMMGLRNYYYQLQEISSDDNVDDTILKEKIIRLRTDNLKNIINRTKVIIEKIANRTKNVGVFEKEKDIVNLFTRNLEKIELYDEDGSNKVFKHLSYILENIQFFDNSTEKLMTFNNTETNLSKQKLLNKNITIFDESLINIQFINQENTSTLLLFYYIFNLERIIDYNSNKNIQSLIIYLICKLIDFNFNNYFSNLNNIDVRRFKYLLYLDEPYANETMRVVGNYSELVDENYTEDDQEKQEILDDREAKESLDIDDYEYEGDEGEGMMEALDFNPE